LYTFEIDNGVSIVPKAFDDIQWQYMWQYLQKHAMMYNLYLLTQNQNVWDIFDLWEAGDKETVTQLFRASVESLRDNFRVASLDEGIAYFVADFLPNVWAIPIDYFYSLMFDFFDEVREYDHFILDLRGTRGNNFWHFMQLVVEPHIPEGNNFQAGTHIFMYEAERMTLLHTPVSGASMVTSTENILRTADLPYLNLDNIEGKEYAMRDVRAFGGHGIDYTLFNGQFDGQIWILVDDKMDFGARMIAFLGQDGGFANVVGETFFLDILNHPDFDTITGDFYVTDSHGRTLEYIVPSFLNREGLDALETALALIAEGN
jgi:hypothetical protein